MLPQCGVLGHEKRGIIPFPRLKNVIKLNFTVKYKNITRELLFLSSPYCEYLNAVIQGQITIPRNRKNWR